jgi:rhamnogalacturonyl hydrolase YesR
MKLSLIIVLILLIQACSNNEFPQESLFSELNDQTLLMRKEASKEHAIPRSVNDDGSTRWIRNYADWTEGFWPGICWMLFERSGDSAWMTEAIRAQHLIAHHRFDSSTHDLGFMINNSFGKAYRLTQDTVYRQILIDAGKTLLTRFDSTTGCIKSWDWAPDKWQFPVIIDNMMNLELLFDLTGITGDSGYYAAAIQHANTTLRNHFRKDSSSFHVVDYDTLSGKVIVKQTHQGYADESSWSRGQSWGLYGYILCYRYTQDEKYLQQAEKIAGYIIRQLPKDLIPPWDFAAPDSLQHFKDVSAASICASALLELADQTGKGEYFSIAERILKELSSENFRAKPGENNFFMLKHAVGSFPEDSEIDVPLIYADYYYLEGLLRLTGEIAWRNY